MFRNIKEKQFQYTLWGIALFLTLFTIIRIFIQFNKPLPSELPEILGEEKSARFYSMIANLLFICVPFGCNLYAESKGWGFSFLSPKLREKINLLRPLLQIFILFVINSRSI